MHGSILQVNELSSNILGRKVFPNYQPSATYTGELFGVEYLYAQLGKTFYRTDHEVDAAAEMVDEGFDDDDGDDGDDDVGGEFGGASHFTHVTLPSDDDSDSEVSACNMYVHMCTQ